jgi:hypothetical protein
MDSQPIEEILADIKIISMLKPNQKLYIADNRLALEKETGYLPALWRYLGNQTRRTVLSKIRQRVCELENYVNNGLIKEEWIQKEFKSLKKSITEGLTHLQETYCEDSQTFVSIDIIIRRVENLL